MASRAAAKAAGPARWSRWQDVRPLPASSRIVEQVRTALFRGELKPGDFLGSESELAAKFGTSRVPVRDAFKALQAMGIIEVKLGARGGARIAHGDPGRFADALAVQFKLVGMGIDEMFNAQIAVEVMAAELAAREATPDDLQSLRALIADMQQMLRKPFDGVVAVRFTQTALDFHEGLVLAAHNRALAAQFKALRFVLEPVYARRTSSAVGRRVVSSQKAILEAVADGDAARACSLLRKRLEAVRARQLLRTAKA